MFLAVSLDTSKDLVFFLLGAFLLLVVVTGLYLVSMIHIDNKQISTKLFNITRAKIVSLFAIGVIFIVISILIYISNLNKLSEDDKLISLCVLIVGAIIVLLTLFMCVSFISHTYNYSIEKAERVFNKLHRGYSIDQTLEMLNRFQIVRTNNILRTQYIYFDRFMKDINTAKITFSYNKLESIEMEDVSRAQK